MNLLEKTTLQEASPFRKREVSALAGGGFILNFFGQARILIRPNSKIDLGMFTG